MVSTLKKKNTEKQARPIGQNDPTRQRSGSSFVAESDVRRDLDTLEQSIEKVRLNYEQFFTGLIPLAPESDHADLKRLIRRLVKAPFKNSQMNFRLRSLEIRYQTFNSYWQRVLREKEEGTYCKDVFKAQIRERNAQEDKHSRTKAGQVSGAMQQLFTSYKNELERASGRTQKLDFDAFQRVIKDRVKEVKQRSNGQKVSFSVVVKDRKVSIRLELK